MSSPQKRLLFVLRDTRYFITHRLPLAQAARRAGYEIAIACDTYDDETAQQINENGFFRFEIPFLRRQGNLAIRISSCLIAVRRALVEFHPEVVHAVSLQSVVICGLLCWVMRRPFIGLIAGFGSVFQVRGLRGKFIRRGVLLTLQVIMANRRAILVFMNEEDRGRLVAGNGVDPSRTLVIRGSGVDTERFFFSPWTGERPLRILMASRLYREKGVGEYLAAASELVHEFPQVEFVLAGDTDPLNPTSYQEEELGKLCAASGVRWIGFQKDMPSLLAQHAVYCLPSYHEGLPLSLLEAAAAGCILVATDIPGCREVVKDSETGFLVQRGDAKHLTDTLRRILREPDSFGALPKNARSLIAQDFSVERVVGTYLDLYKRMTSPRDVRLSERVLP